MARIHFVGFVASRGCRWACYPKYFCSFFWQKGKSVFLGTMSSCGLFPVSLASLWRGWSKAARSANLRRASTSVKLYWKMASFITVRENASVWGWTGSLLESTFHVSWFELNKILVFEWIPLEVGLAVTAICWKQLLMFLKPQRSSSS